MNEQRHQTYIDLIKILLSCPDEEKPEILAANRDLLDADFLARVEDVEEMFSQEQGNENRINRLRELASQLREEFNLSPQNSYLNFSSMYCKQQQIATAIPKSFIPYWQQIPINWIIILPKSCDGGPDKS